MRIEIGIEEEVALVRFSVEVREVLIDLLVEAHLHLHPNLFVIKAYRELGGVSKGHIGESLDILAQFDHQSLVFGFLFPNAFIFFFCLEKCEDVKSIKSKQVRQAIKVESAKRT